MPVVTLRRHFAAAIEGAKLKEFRFHDLRHTFASHFIMQTGDLPTLQKILGHTSSRMTQRYTHLAQEHIATKMAKIDAVTPGLIDLEGTN